MNTQNHILRFENLSRFDSLVHGFSTRFFGDMRPSHPDYQKSQEQFAKALAIVPQKIVRMGQVHKNTVTLVSKKDCGQFVSETDGLFTNEKNVFLGVITADCLPIFFYDPTTQYIAAVHAGWRGLAAEIIKEAVIRLKEKGINPQGLIVGIGPHICVNCYDIANSHSEELLGRFPDWKEFIREKDGKVFLNLAGVAKHQLQQAGVLQNNIEDADYCTFEHEDMYSCRREGKGNFGEIMGIIGFK
jgi:polyphenol oxidase